MKRVMKTLTPIVLVCWVQVAFSQQAYFVDGYHGGVWGHYPEGNTRFIVDMLEKHPDWKINIEIEPDTWDTARAIDPAAYSDFKALFADQSLKGRIEYVNPTYGQSYFFNASGESAIRQFYYGMKKLRDHFPEAVYTTYSSEEPCFTSALPQILKSYGYKFASLKNPNTCWGGYTRAFGGELVNWVGPDHSSIVTVPRYAVEALEPNSTWQTTAWNNSKAYLRAALNDGIENPVGMCLQDAGWTNGPWLGDGSRTYLPSQYVTWRDYIENISIRVPRQDWKFSQEDMQVSLVWGSQILQRLGQQVRSAEHKIVAAEKIAAMAAVYRGAGWPAEAFEQAWTPLLLAQHHDCWIVPYNRKHHTNWAGLAADWTQTTQRISDSIIQVSTRPSIGSSPVAGNASNLSNGGAGNNESSINGGRLKAGKRFIRVFNTTGAKRQEWVSFELPRGWEGEAQIRNSRNRKIPSQIVSHPQQGNKKILFRADVPAVGYDTYQLVKSRATGFRGASASQLADGRYRLESDLYTIIIDPRAGGAITSLVAKNLGNREFVDQQHERGFNEIRGNFYKDGGFRSSKDIPATIEILENGPARARLAIHGTIAGHPFTQWVTLVQGQRRIDLSIKIDWQGNPGIGNDYAQNKQWDPRENRKAFYDDREKLLLLFPLNLSSQKLYKNAPFDVTESAHDNTFFTTWDSIKHNIILNWIDVTDGADAYGMAVLSDHTSSYVHGKDHPAGLTLQYSGIGLWGRNYSITGPTEMHYAIIPHRNTWDKSGIWTESEKWNEPLIVSELEYTKESERIATRSPSHRSLLDLAGSGWQVSALTMEGNDLLVRLFNAEGDSTAKKISFDLNIKDAHLVELNGDKTADLKISGGRDSRSVIEMAMPRFGFRTIRIPGAGGTL